MPAEPIQIIEIDVDYCSLEYGQAPCAAVLGDTGMRKCFNMYRHCQDQENFATSTLTLRFVEPSANIPVEYEAFPCLVSVSASSSTVNISGMDTNLSTFGRRARVQVNLANFKHHDRGIDKYTSERISGAAQADGVGYDPNESGTFFSRLRSRFPYYAGRALRVIDATVENGVLTPQVTRNFVISEWSASKSDRITIVAKDVLSLADNDKAVCPRPNRGGLLAEVLAADTVATLQPEGIGDVDYPESGFANIGRELVAFTRVGDDLTLTERGVSGTEIEDHGVEDSVQVSFSPRLRRIDDVIEDLLVNYAEVPAAFIPKATWASEIDRWSGGLRIDTDILKPERVADLVGELSVLGISIWWDEVRQEVGLKMVRPPDDDTVFELNDDANIKEISYEDREDERITEISFYTVIRDASENSDEAKNYERQRYTVDLNAKTPNAYGGTRLREITCRWLNHGADTQVGIISRRILKRLNSAPRRYTILLDKNDDAISLTDVLRVRSYAIEDEAGQEQEALLQVVRIAQKNSGHDFEVLAQAYEYDGRIGYIPPDGIPPYSLATDAQRNRYFYIVDENTLKFPDGTDSYEVI